MCTGLEIAAIIGATAAAGGTAASLAKGSPKMPAQVQASQSPTADAFKSKNAAAMNPGAALANSAPSLLSGAGPSQNVGTSTLLGQ